MAVESLPRLRRPLVPTPPRVYGVHTYKEKLLGPTDLNTQYSSLKHSQLFLGGGFYPSNSNMDAFGVLGATIQFINFSTALVSTNTRIRRSKGGELQRVSEDGRTIAEELVEHSREMEDSCSSGQAAPEFEKQIRIVRGECGAAAQELIHAVRELKGHRLSCRNEKFENFQEALETVWTQEDIEQLQNNLRDWQSCLVILTVSALR